MVFVADGYMGTKQQQQPHPKLLCRAGVRADEGRAGGGGRGNMLQATMVVDNAYGWRPVFVMVLVFGWGR